MLKKIYYELAAIRKELQSIRCAMEYSKEKRAVAIGIDFSGDGKKDFTPDLSSLDWENALKRLEKANHQGEINN